MINEFSVSPENPWWPRLQEMNRRILQGAALDAKLWQSVYEAAYSWEKNTQLKEQAVNKKQPQTSTARIGRPAPPLSGDDARPKCTKHNVFMKYNPAEDRMECTTDKCTRVARKRRTFRDVLGAEMNESPVTYRGSLEFIIDDSGELYLFLPEVNAAVSLMSTSNMDLFDDDDDAKAPAMNFLNAVRKAATLADPTVERLKRRMRLTHETEEAIARQRSRTMLTVTGHTGLRGVLLPPHINISDAALIDKKYHTVSFDKSLCEEDRISHAIELFKPTVFKMLGSKFDAVTTCIYTVNGDFVQHVEYEYPAGNDMYKYDMAMDELRALTEGTEPVDQPLYIMLDGLALTAAGCRKLRLQYSQYNSKKRP